MQQNHLVFTGKVGMLNIWYILKAPVFYSSHIISPAERTVVSSRQPLLFLPPSLGHLARATQTCPYSAAAILLVGEDRLPLALSSPSKLSEEPLARRMERQTGGIGAGSVSSQQLMKSRTKKLCVCWWGGGGRRRSSCGESDFDITHYAVIAEV